MEQITLSCPECQGVGFISLGHLDPEYHGKAIPCPTCEGTGSLPDPAAFPNHCPGCGEPIPAHQIWCDFHAASAKQMPD